MSRDELQQVTREFVEYHTLHGRDRQAILEAAGRFGKYANTLKDGKAGPAALSLRHARIAANYFDPDVQDTLFLRLLTAPDPVRAGRGGCDVRSLNRCPQYVMSYSICRRILGRYGCS